MTCWEYMVIHLNVEPPAAPPTKGPGEKAGEGTEGPAGSKPVFSRNFLAKEFPQFYEGQQPQEPAASKPQHPAQQLQSFLNGHGSQGWELVGVFPVGVLSMLFFRRPAAEAPAPPADPATPAELTVEQATLQRVLQRLEALEGQLSAPMPSHSAPSQASPPPAAPPLVDPQPAPQADRRLLLQLQDAPTLVTPAAAQAIGLRSAASLANLAARHGYLPGLYKVGTNGLAAVYQGEGTAKGGGRAQRLWCVVPADQVITGALGGN